jgi:hypothetical protein
MLSLWAHTKHSHKNERQIHFFKKKKRKKERKKEIFYHSVNDAAATAEFI